MSGCKFDFNDSQSIVQMSSLVGPEIVDLSVGSTILVITVIFGVLKKTDMFCYSDHKT